MWLLTGQTTLVSSASVPKKIFLKVLGFYSIILKTAFIKMAHIYYRKSQTYQEECGNYPNPITRDDSMIVSVNILGLHQIGGVLVHFITFLNKVFFELVIQSQDSRSNFKLCLFLNNVSVRTGKYSDKPGSSERQNHIPRSGDTTILPPSSQRAFCCNRFTCTFYMWMSNL